MGGVPPALPGGYIPGPQPLNYLQVTALQTRPSINKVQVTNPSLKNLDVSVHVFVHSCIRGAC